MGHKTMPATKPPTCAHHAMPPAVPGASSEKVPEKNCMKNHAPRNITAGSSIIHGKKNTGTSVIILEYGNMVKYAPITPAIAPDAPMAGTTEPALNTT